MVHTDDDADRTLWCGNLHEKVTEELLYELFLQAGPLEKVKVITPASGSRYAFITFRHKVSVQYTVNLMNGLRLFDKPLRLQTRTVSGVSKPSSSYGSCPNTPVYPGMPGVGSSSQSPAPALHHVTPLFPSHPARFPSAAITPPSVGFHRSYSTPDCGAVDNNGGAQFHRPSDERRSGFLPVPDRTPYARPASRQNPSRQNSYQQQNSSNIDQLNLMAQLHVIRQTVENGHHMTPRLPVDRQRHGDMNSPYHNHHQRHSRNNGNNSYRSHR